MDSSKRAVESYWRSRMIDAATSDEDKVTPVYKLEEICDLLRSSHFSIIKEVSDFILKRLDHKSPIVKQKALRLIKYAVGKSGAEFRREMQRHSVAVRQLFHYKGQPDPLKGDALNKAVRDTAHEAISAIFSEENNKPSPAENLSKRIQGFGSTNFDASSDDRKSSFLSEVVGMGSASIKQGISNFTQGNLLKKNDNRSYKGPNLRSSFSTETDSSDRYEPVRLPAETQSNFGVSKPSGPWGQDSKVTNTETANGSSSSHNESKTHEERLLETIVTSGGVRLQPTRDAIQLFLVEAAKLDALALSHALVSKLQSPMWQVRMKAVCVLEAILRKKDDDHFSIVASYFTENYDVVVRCSESPQNSLREKADKVLSLLGGEQSSGGVGNSEKIVKAEVTSVQMPNLIDTGDADDFLGTDDPTMKPIDQITTNPTTPATPLVDDIFGDSFGSGLITTDQKNDDDPFADVSFHGSGTRDQADNLFPGLAVGDKTHAGANNLAMHKAISDPFDIFGSNNEIPDKPESNQTDVSDLMAGMSVTENVPETKQKGGASQGMFSDLSSHSNSSHEISSDALKGINASPMFTTGMMPYNMPPGVMLNPAFYSQAMNYGGMGSFLAQQQLLATMSNFQHLNDLNAQNTGANNAAMTHGGGYSSPFPDIFQPNFANQPPSSLMNSSKKEETRAFDFISDHLAAARDPKRVV